jgi:hypothetical protein
MDNQRHPFGGDASTVAEDNSGRRIPNSSGNVYRNKVDLQAETDLLNEDGSAASLVHTDDKGMVLPFFGPPGAATLWLDFGAGRYQIFATDVISAAAEHIAAGYDEDPHGTLQQARTEMQSFVTKNGLNDIPLTANQRWLTLLSSEVAPTGDTLIQRRSDSKYNFALRQNGSVTHFAQSDAHTPLEIAAGEKPPATALIINDGVNRYEKSAFKVDFKGNVTTTGNVTANTVTASNIGGARVFSGPEAPANPKVGDVWVKYG